MQQPNYPPRGYGGQAPPQQQQAPRSGGGYAPPNAGYGNMQYNQQQQQPMKPPGPRFPGVQQPQAPHSGLGGRPGFPGQVQQVPAPGSQGSFRPGQQLGGPPAPASQGSFRPGQQLGGPPAPGSQAPSDPANSGVPQVNRGPPGTASGLSAYPGQGSPAPGSFQNAAPAAGPGSFQSGPPGPQGPSRQQFQQGPPGQDSSLTTRHLNREAGRMQSPPPPQFNGQQGPPQGGAAPYLQPNRNAGPYPGPPGPGAPAPPYNPPGAPGAYGQPQQGGYPQQQQPQASQAPKQRIDPTQIPRPVVSGERVQYVARGHTVTMPPAASSDYVCVDEVWTTAGRSYLPTCGPARGRAADPTVDFGPSGPLRCTRCAAYVNSFTKFIQGGRKFVCNICQLNNETPRDYYCSVDQYGKRRDIQERAELSRGSVEYVVPAAYTIRPPQEPILVFVLDVSLFAFQTGLATSALQSIQYLLPSMAQNKRKKIGIVTFDTAVHYYRMNNGSSWLVSMDDPAASDKITELAEVITRSFENTTKNQPVADALSVSGGRVVLLHAGAPRMGIGRVKREEVSGAYGTTKECAEHHISLDVFSVANTFASLADVGRVCELTGGRVQYMPQFEKEQSSNRHHLTSMLQRLVDRDCGYEAVLKCAAALGCAWSTHEMEFAVIDQDRSMCVTFAYDEPLAEATDAYIQAALLYTRSDGLRCVRVHNLALQVEPLLSNVFRFADLDATCSVWQRSAARQFVDKQLMRSLVDQCVTVLFNYRKFCASSSSSGQLILPESLKLLPLYTLATLKSRALRGNLVGNPPRGFIDVRADERVMMMGLLNSLPVEFCVSAVYPKLYSVHDLADDCCTLDEDGKFILPPQLPPTAEKLDEEGIFLLHSAMCCYIYIGPKASPELLLDLFGGDGMGARERLRSLVEYLNSTIPISQPLEILTKNDWRANRFMSALVEDRTRNDVSYVEFLVQVHKKIQYKFH
ncbi:ADF-H/Gelsolin-like domain [Phytophthora cactorum]|nr:ADF-H/Gelsolin-like domain [Phytophthora cactorum]